MPQKPLILHISNKSLFFFDNIRFLFKDAPYIHEKNIWKIQELPQNINDVATRIL